jgi:hypothetical protein
MTGLDKTPKTPRPNPNSQDEIMEKLKRGERIELSDLGITERLRAEEFAKARPENLNLAIRFKEGVIVRSGGYEIRIDSNKVTVYGRDGEVVHEYANECLASNITTLLMNVLTKYGVLYTDRWFTASLPRTDRMVRRLQSWLLAVISNFAVPLKHNPLICD